MQTPEPWAKTPIPTVDPLCHLLAAAVGAMENGVTITDMQQSDQPLLYVNAGFEALTGYTAQEVIGRNCRFLQGAERDQEALPIVRRALQQGESCAVILRNYRKDGSPFWNELSLYPLYSDQGRLTHYVGIQHDISEIVERSKRLIRSERKSAQEATQQARSMTLLNEMSRQFNVAVTEEEVCQIAGCYIPQIIQADTIRLTLRTDDEKQLKITLLPGVTDALHISEYVPIQDTEIEQGLWADAVQFQAEPERKRLAEMASRIHAPLMTGGRTIGALTAATQAAYAFTEREEHLLLQTASMLAANIQSRRLFAQMQAALHENTRLYKVEREHSRALQHALEQLNNAQAQLVAAEKMASLGRLVAGLAHEINTPIGIAVTAASIWEDQANQLWQLYQNRQMKRADFEAFLQLITESGKLISNNLNRAADLIHSFKQVAVDQSSEAVRSINLKRYMSEVIASLRPELKRTHLTVAVVGDEELVLPSYPGALSQIMTNLIMNSVTHAYAPDAYGRLTITIKRQADKACLEYADDGQGIPPEDLNKIFEPFFTTRRAQGGSGLGLPIVYNLVTQKLNGTINVQSQVGVGTTFTISLPLSIDHTG